MAEAQIVAIGELLIYANSRHGIVIDDCMPQVVIVSEIPKKLYRVLIEQYEYFDNEYNTWKMCLQNGGQPPSLDRMYEYKETDKTFQMAYRKMMCGSYV